jgi:oligopeptidase B
MDQPTPLAPPQAPQKPFPRVHHGQTRIDPYAWLKDENWQKVMQEPDLLAADIRQYLEAENNYTSQVLAPTEALQDELFREMKGRIKEDDSSVPAQDGPWLYYQRFEIGAQHPIFCRRPNAGSGAEQVLLDGNVEGKDQAFFRIVGSRHAPDHRLLAWSADRKGSEFATLQVRDLATGIDLAERIENAQGDIAWANDGRTLFYTLLDEHHRPYRILRHQIGEDPAKDAVVYEERDPGFFLSLEKTQSRRFILIVAHDHTTTETWTVDADQADSAPKLIAPRQRDVEYETSHRDDRFYFLTNADGAEDFKVAWAPVDAPGRENWRDLIAHQPGCLLRTLNVLKDWLVRMERIEGLPRIVVRCFADEQEHIIAFDEAVYSLFPYPGYEFATNNLRFTYSSLATPEQVYDYDLARRSRVLRKEQEVPSGHNPADYVTRRVFATSHDGVQVPISLFHRKSTPIDGSAPLLLYGYGSYGLSIPASFTPNRLSLVDRGFVYAIAHIRGGTDRGYGWYRNGKLMKKTNTFRDFVACAEKLVVDGYAKPGEIAAQGGSAGGMLMGWLANERPDLFRAIVAEVPFVDVLTTMLDDSLPLTPPEWQEWGNPITDRAAYDYIFSYSPYDNVRAQAYPNMLVLAGLTDPRVTYWEPAKWVAKLRTLKTDQNGLLLRTNMQAGHAGASGRFDRLKETALVYAFILKVFGKG